MNEVEFLEKVNEVIKFDPWNVLNPSDYNHKNKKRKYEFDDYIFIKWETCGVRGGSCWETSDPQPYSSDNPEPVFEDLDKILEVIFPEISYLKYKKLQNKIEFNHYTDYEYYGNYTNYNIKKIKLSDIYNFVMKEV